MEVGGNKSVACSKTDAKGGGANIPGKKSGELCRDADKNEVRMDVTTAGASASAVSNVGFSGWHHSSRIIRVPRTSAGKDRHSKVLTYRGLRDRRIRLSVTTAIQFYDLLDRLGYDQPSKAVEWLIKAAEAPIANLPSLPSVEESIFATAEQSVAEQKQPVEETADVEDDDVKTALQKYDRNNPDHQRRHLPVSSSGYSSTSETSKGSELSLSRLEVRAHRMKARERAREWAVKEKEREKERKFPTVVRRQDLNPNSTPPHHGSFTDLLTGAGTRRIRCPISNSSAYTMHQAKHWPSPPTDYFNFSHTAPSSSSSRPQYGTPGHGYFTQQIQIGSFSPQPQTFPVAAFGTAGVHQNSVVQEHLLPPASEYDRIRGTLQSNSPSFLLPQHVQRFSTAEESAMSYVLGSPPSPPGAHSILPISDGRLQLFYGDGSYRHTNPKDKESN